MVIHDGNLSRTRRSPAKDKPPLIVNPDGVIARPPAPQGLQTISRWHGKVRKLSRAVHLHEFPQKHPGNGGKASIAFLFEKLASVGVGK